MMSELSSPMTDHDENLLDVFVFYLYFVKNTCDDEEDEKKK